MDKAMEALKPCPFCGGAATLSDGESGDFNVCCHSRDCFGPHTALYYLRSEAIAAWNTRATPEPVAPPSPDIAGIVDELVTALQRVAQERDAATKDASLYEQLYTDAYELACQQIDRAEAAEARIATARDEGLEMALEPFAADRRHSLEYDCPVYCDDDPKPTHNKWVIWREEGNINDREWVVVASGDTPAAAIRALKGTKQ